MKTFRKSVFFLILLSIPAFVISCQEDDSTSTSSGNCYDELAELSQILSEKSQAFSANQTRSNCNALRTAALDQLDALDDCTELSAQERETYQMAAEFWVDYDCTLWD